MGEKGRAGQVRARHRSGARFFVSGRRFSRRFWPVARGAVLSFRTCMLLESIEIEKACTLC